MGEGAGEGGLGVIEDRRRDGWKDRTHVTKTGTMEVGSKENPGRNSLRGGGLEEGGRGRRCEERT